jgi:hypothetical protein
MREILRSTDPTVIAWASALLAGEDIETFALDVYTSAVLGIEAVPQRLMVRPQDAFRARAVLADNGVPTGL